MIVKKLQLTGSEGSHNFNVRHNLSHETMNQFIGFARFVKYAGDASILDNAKNYTYYAHLQKALI